MYGKDRPSGFRTYGQVYEPLDFVKTTDEIITEGDLVKVTTTGVRLAGATDAVLLGVAAETKAAADTTIKVYTHPAQFFIAQCSGTLTQAIVGTAVDMEGTTGIQEINENASTYKVVQVITPVPGETIGLNSEVVCALVRHINASDATPLATDAA